MISPPCSGKSTTTALLAEYYGAVVVDVETLMQRTIGKFTKDMLDKVRQDATLAGLEKVRNKMQLEATMHQVRKYQLGKSTKQAPWHDIIFS